MNQSFNSVISVGTKRRRRRTQAFDDPVTDAMAYGIEMEERYKDFAKKNRKILTNSTINLYRDLVALTKRKVIDEVGPDNFITEVSNQAYLLEEELDRIEAGISTTPKRQQTQLRAPPGTRDIMNKSMILPRIDPLQQSVQMMDQLLDDTLLNQTTVPLQKQEADVSNITDAEIAAAMQEEEYFMDNPDISQIEIQDNEDYAIEQGDDVAYEDQFDVAMDQYEAEDGLIVVIDEQTRARLDQNKMQVRGLLDTQKNQQDVIPIKPKINKQFNLDEGGYFHTAGYKYFVQNFLNNPFYMDFFFGQDVVPSNSTIDSTTIPEKSPIGYLHGTNMAFGGKVSDLKQNYKIQDFEDYWSNIGVLAEVMTTLPFNVPTKMIEDVSDIDLINSLPNVRDLLDKEVIRPFKLQERAATLQSSIKLYMAGKIRDDLAKKNPTIDKASLMAYTPSKDEFEQYARTTGLKESDAVMGAITESIIDLFKMPQQPHTLFSIATVDNPRLFKPKFKNNNTFSSVQDNPYEYFARQFYSGSPLASTPGKAMFKSLLYTVRQWLDNTKQANPIRQFLDKQVNDSAIVLGIDNSLRDLDKVGFDRAVPVEVYNKFYQIQKVRSDIGISKSPLGTKLYNSALSFIGDLDQVVMAPLYNNKTSFATTLPPEYKINWAKRAAQKVDRIVTGNQLPIQYFADIDRPRDDFMQFDDSTLKVVRNDWSNQSIYGLADARADYFNTNYDSSKLPGLVDYKSQILNNDLDTYMAKNEADTVKLSIEAGLRQPAAIVAEETKRKPINQTGNITTPFVAPPSVVVGDGQAKVRGRIQQFTVLSKTDFSKEGQAELAGREQAIVSNKELCCIACKMKIIKDDITLKKLVCCTGLIHGNCYKEDLLKSLYACSFCDKPREMTQGEISAGELQQRAAQVLKAKSIIKDEYFVPGAPWREDNEGDPARLEEYLDIMTQFVATGTPLEKDPKIKDQYREAMKQLSSADIDIRYWERYIPSLSWDYLQMAHRFYDHQIIKKQLIAEGKVDKAAEFDISAEIVNYNAKMKAGNKAPVISGEDMIKVHQADLVKKQMEHWMDNYKQSAQQVMYGGDAEADVAPELLALDLDDINLRIANQSTGMYKRPDKKQKITSRIQKRNQKSPNTSMLQEAANAIQEKDMIKASQPPPPIETSAIVEQVADLNATSVVVQDNNSSINQIEQPMEEEVVIQQPQPSPPQAVVVQQEELDTFNQTGTSVIAADNNIFNNSFQSNQSAFSLLTTAAVVDKLKTVQSGYQQANQLILQNMGRIASERGNPVINAPFAGLSQNYNILPQQQPGQISRVFMPPIIQGGSGIGASGINYNNSLTNMMLPQQNTQQQRQYIQYQKEEVKATPPTPIENRKILTVARSSGQPRARKQVARSASVEEAKAVVVGEISAANKQIVDILKNKAFGRLTEHFGGITNLANQIVDKEAQLHKDLDKIAEKVDTIKSLTDIKKDKQSMLSEFQVAVNEAAKLKEELNKVSIEYKDYDKKYKKIKEEGKALGEKASKVSELLKNQKNKAEKIDKFQQSLETQNGRFKHGVMLERGKLEEIKKELVGIEQYFTLPTAVDVVSKIDKGIAYLDGNQQDGKEYVSYVIKSDLEMIQDAIKQQQQEKNRDLQDIQTKQRQYATAEQDLKVKQVQIDAYKVETDKVLDKLGLQKFKSTADDDQEKLVQKYTEGLTQAILINDAHQRSLGHMKGMEDRIMTQIRNKEDAVTRYFYTVQGFVEDLARNNIGVDTTTLKGLLSPHAYNVGAMDDKTLESVKAETYNIIQTIKNKMQGFNVQQAILDRFNNQIGSLLKSAESMYLDDIKFQNTLREEITELNRLYNGGINVNGINFSQISSDQVTYLKGQLKDEYNRINLELWNKKRQQDEFGRLIEGLNQKIDKNQTIEDRNRALMAKASDILQQTSYENKPTAQQLFAMTTINEVIQEQGKIVAEIAKKQQKNLGLQSSISELVSQQRELDRENRDLQQLQKEEHRQIEEQKQTKLEQLALKKTADALRVRAGLINLGQRIIDEENPDDQVKDLFDGAFGIKYDKFLDAIKQVTNIQQAYNENKEHLDTAAKRFISEITEGDQLSFKKIIDNTMVAVGKANAVQALTTQAMGKQISDTATSAMNAFQQRMNLIIQLNSQNNNLGLTGARAEEFRTQLIREAGSLKVIMDKVQNQSDKLLAIDTKLMTNSLLGPQFKAKMSSIQDASNSDGIYANCMEVVAKLQTLQTMLIDDKTIPSINFIDSTASFVLSKIGDINKKLDNISDDNLYNKISQSLHEISVNVIRPWSAANNGYLSLDDSSQIKQQYGLGQLRSLMYQLLEKKINNFVLNGGQNRQILFDQDNSRLLQDAMNNGIFTGDSLQNAKTNIESFINGNYDLLKAEFFEKAGSAISAKIKPILEQIKGEQLGKLLANKSEARQFMAARLNLSEQEQSRGQVKQRLKTSFSSMWENTKKLSLQYADIIMGKVEQFNELNQESAKEQANENVRRKLATSQPVYTGPSKFIQPARDSNQGIFSQLFPAITVAKAQQEIMATNKDDLPAKLKEIYEEKKELNKLLQTLDIDSNNPRDRLLLKSAQRRIYGFLTSEVLPAYDQLTGKNYQNFNYENNIEDLEPHIAFEFSAALLSALPTVIATIVQPSHEALNLNLGISQDSIYDMIAIRTIVDFSFETFKTCFDDASFMELYRQTYGADYDQAKFANIRNNDSRDQLIAAVDEDGIPIRRNMPEEPPGFDEVRTRINRSLINQTKNVIKTSQAQVQNNMEILDELEKFSLRRAKDETDFDKMNKVNEQMDKMSDGLQNTLLNKFFDVGLRQFINQNPDQRKLIQNASQQAFPRYFPGGSAPSASGTLLQNNQQQQQQQGVPQSAAAAASNSQQQQSSGSAGGGKPFFAFPGSTAATSGDPAKDRLSGEAIKQATRILSRADMAFLTYIKYDDRAGVLQYFNPNDPKKIPPRNLTDEEKKRFIAVMIQLIIALYQYVFQKLSKQKKKEAQADLHKKYGEDADEGGLALFKMVNKLVSKMGEKRKTDKQDEEMQQESEQQQQQ